MGIEYLFLLDLFITGGEFAFLLYQAFSTFFPENPTHVPTLGIINSLNENYAQNISETETIVSSVVSKPEAIDQKLSSDNSSNVAFIFYGASLFTLHVLILFFIK